MYVRTRHEYVGEVGIYGRAVSAWYWERYYRRLCKGVRRWDATAGWFKREPRHAMVVKISDESTKCVCGMTSGQYVDSRDRRFILFNLVTWWESESDIEAAQETRRAWEEEDCKSRGGGRYEWQTIDVDPWNTERRRVYKKPAQFTAQDGEAGDRRVVRPSEWNIRTPGQAADPFSIPPALGTGSGLGNDTLEEYEQPTIVSWDEGDQFIEETRFESKGKWWVSSRRIFNRKTGMSNMMVFDVPELSYSPKLGIETAKTDVGAAWADVIERRVNPDTGAVSWVVKTPTNDGMDMIKTVTLTREDAVRLAERVWGARNQEVASQFQKAKAAIAQRRDLEIMNGQAKRARREDGEV